MGDVYYQHGTEIVIISGWRRLSRLQEDIAEQRENMTCLARLDTSMRGSCYDSISSSKICAVPHK